MSQRSIVVSARTVDPYILWAMELNYIWSTPGSIGASRGPLDVARDITAGDSQRSKRIWSAGHRVWGVTEILDVAELFARTEAEYRG